MARLGELSLLPPGGPPGGSRHRRPAVSPPNRALTRWVALEKSADRRRHGTCSGQTGEDRVGTAGCGIRLAPVLLRKAPARSQHASPSAARKSGYALRCRRTGLRLAVAGFREGTSFEGYLACGVHARAGLRNLANATDPGGTRFASIDRWVLMLAVGGLKNLRFTRRPRSRGPAALILVSLWTGLVSSCARTGLLVDGSEGQCIRLDATAEPAELAVYVMLDTSRSMAFETAEGTTKARAVRNALSDFFADPESAGMAVALSFFPILRPEVPDSCLDDAACGEPGACRPFSKLCLPSAERTCDSDADCATNDPLDVCAELGGCSNDPQTLCVVGYDPSAHCPAGASCAKLGACENAATCDAERYGVPVVELATLPAARTGLLLALDTRDSDGGTPLLPALTGALRAARADTQGHLGRKAIVVLATDGFPSVCDPDVDPRMVEPSDQGIDNLVAVAEPAARDGVETFVVGVFAPEEEQFARTNLDRIARAGDTEHAFIITTDESVSRRLVDTLDAIRNDARKCEFAIPWPAGGGHDARTLSVHLKGRAGAEPIEPVADAAACDSGAGGFYFDRSPALGIVPRRVILCEATCARLASEDRKTVEVRADCGA
jgi:hypothetical protein